MHGKVFYRSMDISKHSKPGKIYLMQFISWSQPEKQFLKPWRTDLGKLAYNNKIEIV